MDEEKFVTLEMFEQYDKLLKEYIDLEKDSLNLARLAVDVAYKYNGHIDISEAANTLINMFKKDK